MDYLAVGAALSARFAALAGPTGYDAVRVSTHLLPNQMTPLPTVLIFADKGDLNHYVGDRRGSQEWLARFYYDQTGDLPRAQEALLRWLPILEDRLRGAVQLGGIVGVSAAQITGWQMGTLHYGGEDYVGIELVIEVVTAEGWAAVA